LPQRNRNRIKDRQQSTGKKASSTSFDCLPAMSIFAKKTRTDAQPFGPAAAPERPASSAFVTMLLALYPVVAAIAVAMAGLAVAAPN